MATSAGSVTSACRRAVSAVLTRADVSKSAVSRSDVSCFASGARTKQSLHQRLGWHSSAGFSGSWTCGVEGVGTERPFTRGVGLRRFQVVSPVCMGRRSSKIATRKNAQDARKSKLYGKVGKQIISAVKAGGPSPASNSQLAALLVAAKQGGVPKDVIDRNIKRATEKGQADFTEIVYEIYGLGGVGIVVDVLTDNNARAAATVRDVVRKGGAKMADPGSVLFNFKRQGVLAVPAATADPDEVLVVAVDSGADDVINPGEDVAGGGGEHGEEGEEEEQFFRVLTPAESFASVRAQLQEYGLTVDAEHSGLMFIPTARMQTDEEAREQNEAIMEKLLELDDVDAVYCNQ
ncbi:hypothetical protein CLOM_g24096 [Closterium sp. NIES-68]|nr:hypothetical protein CLOM_g24096 [Closterium sp. NIES-68]GJP58487.1 hypothetical protein CLOP_g87 [Closterium sp. NIES-67]